MKNIFITGASGCVGHYVFDVLSANPDYHLFLFVRDPARLKFDLGKYSNVTIVRGEMKEVGQQAELLNKMDYVVHIAAGWGETELNNEYTIELFKLLNQSRIKKVIYFSTASIMGDNNKVFEGCDKLGTSYIRGKYLAYKELPKLAIYDRIITLFPTWVLGGDSSHPYSHATMGIIDSVKWLWLMRFLSVDVGFHFIHAKDMAVVVDYLLKNEVKEKEYILGNSYILADQFINQMCAYFKKKVYFKIPIPIDVVEHIAPLFRFNLHAWDKYCLEKKHFEYKVTNPGTFGLKADYPDVKSILVSLNV
ncbi:MAG: NAD(P)-dependent oxidoreductase [Candidatus Margulisiibacteriota bacterium]